MANMNLNSSFPVEPPRRLTRAPKKFTPSDYEKFKSTLSKPDQNNAEANESIYCCGKVLVGAEMIKCSGGRACLNRKFDYVLKNFIPRNLPEDQSLFQKKIFKNLFFQNF